VLPSTPTCGLLADITTWPLTLLEILPEASFAHAYKVFVPSEAKVYEDGAVVLHPVSLAFGTFEDSVILKPETIKLSYAVKLLTGTISEPEVVGSTNELTVGGVLSTAFTAVVLISILEVKGSKISDWETGFPFTSL
jgi:hypothetical protein